MVAQAMLLLTSSSQAFHIQYASRCLASQHHLPKLGHESMRKHCSPSAESASFLRTTTLHCSEPGNLYEEYLKQRDNGSEVGGSETSQPPMAAPTPSAAPIPGAMPSQAAPTPSTDSPYKRIMEAYRALEAPSLPQDLPTGVSQLKTSFQSLSKTVENAYSSVKEASPSLDHSNLKGPATACWRRSCDRVRGRPREARERNASRPCLAQGPRPGDGE